MTIEQAQKAIALLIDLAETGEIDPWDVQVIEVIDRFLSEIGITEEANPQKADLPQSGQAFLSALMLVLLKANTLSQLEEDEHDEIESELTPIDIVRENEDNHKTLPRSLENHIRRRSNAPPLRKRKVTLAELIQQIQTIASQLAQKSPTSPSKSPRLQSRREAAKAITQLAHEENFTELANFLEQFFLFNFPQVNAEETGVDLDRLLDLLPLPQEDRVGVFWALLLLSAESKVELVQHEFYQDLSIKPILAS